MNGTILWYSERDKNGIIVDSLGNEYYFDSSVWLDRMAPIQKQFVSFEVNSKIKECLCAKNVKDFCSSQMGA